MATTVTASLALASANVLSHHAGVNLISGSHVGVISTSASGMVLLAKIPVNATVHQLEFYHQNVATNYAMKVGYRNGVSESFSASAFMTSGTAGTQRSMIKDPVDLSAGWDDAGGERFKYLIATVKDVSDTGSVSLNFRCYYTINS